MPGVVHASMSDGLPLSGGISSTTITVPGTAIDLSAGQSVVVRRVTPDYHNALGIPLRRGRLFNDTDRSGAPDVVIISESAAKKILPW